MVGERDSVLVEGIIPGEKIEVGSFGEIFQRKDVNDDLMLRAIDQCAKANDISAFFYLLKKAENLSDKINIKFAEVLKEKAWTSFAEEFVNIKGVCEEAKEIAKGGIWPIKRGRQVPPKRFGRPKRTIRPTYNAPLEQKVANR